jgi:hypothetical protein
MFCERIIVAPTTVVSGARVKELGRIGKKEKALEKFFTYLRRLLEMWESGLNVSVRKKGKQVDM